MPEEVVQSPAEVTPPETVVETPAAEPTPVEDIEAKEWENAAKDLFPDKIKDETTTDTTTTETTTTETTTEETTVDAATTTDSTTTTPETTTEATTQAAPVDTKSIESRMAQREFEASVEAVKADVREKMFGDVLSDLKDAQGTPITGPKDLESLINPVTNEAFTPEDAQASWGKYMQQRAVAESQVDQIAKVNATLKDEADLITSKYGKVLSADPELKNRLFAQYDKSLEKDPKTGVIIKAPFSLLEYYDSILEPRLTADTVAQQQVQEAETARVEAEKKANEIKKAQTQADRSDIFGNGQKGNLTKDEEEWNQAAKEYYGK